MNARIHDWQRRTLVVVLVARRETPNVDRWKPSEYPARFPQVEQAGAGRVMGVLSVLRNITTAGWSYRWLFTPLAVDYNATVLCLQTSDEGER